MNSRITARISAAVVLAFALSFMFHHMGIQHNKMGKTAYETSQAQRFDKFYAKPQDPTAPVPLLSALVMAGLFLGAYELLAFGIYQVIKPRPSASGT